MPRSPAAPHVDPRTALLRSAVDHRVRYRMWQLETLPLRDDLYRQRVASLAMPYQPMISIITPVFDTPPDLLERALRSVANQTYPHWQHCLVDDGSSLEWIAPYLERCAARDPRIRFARRPVNGGIVAASNHARALATGEFVSMLDHDDELDPQALYAVAAGLNRQRDTDVFYSDFDTIDRGGRHSQGWFLPDWSPELLLSWPYVAHLTVFRRALVEQLGGWRTEFEGSQDYDLALRAASVTDRFVHLPQVLYHWRQWERSVANNPEAKPYAYEAAKAAISDHLVRNGVAGRRADRPTDPVFPYAVQFEVLGRPLVSVIVPAPDDANPETAVAGVEQAIRDGGHEDCEVVFVVSERRLALWTPHIQGRAVPMSVVPHTEDQDGDAGRILNLGAGASRGEHLVFLAHPVSAVGHGWLKGMLEYSQQSAIGAVGARIVAEHGYIWHRGVLFPRGVPHLLQVDYPLVNFSAVSGVCLMTRREVFDQAGGFQPEHEVGHSDFDYCLRLREFGYRHVVSPGAGVRLVGPPPAPATTDASRRFAECWHSRFPRDPYYNQNFCQDDATFTVQPGSWSAAIA